MNEELKKCPFCGSDAGRFEKDAFLPYVRCANDFCEMSKVKLSEAYWNRRPAEDSKDAEIEKLNKALREIQDYGCTIADETGWVCSAITDCKKLQDEIYRLANCLYQVHKAYKEHNPEWRLMLELSVESAMQKNYVQAINLPSTPETTDQTPR